MHMRTTVELSDAILRSVKALAQKRHTTVRAMIEEGLRLVLERESRASRERFTLEDCSYGTGGMVDGLDESSWAEIRDLSYKGRGG